MYVSNLNEREIQLVIKSLENTLNELREINNKYSMLNLDNNEHRRTGKNQILKSLREYEDLTKLFELALSIKQGTLAK